MYSVKLWMSPTKKRKSTLILILCHHDKRLDVVHKDLEYKLSFRQKFKFSVQKHFLTVSYNITVLYLNDFTAGEPWSV